MIGKIFFDSFVVFFVCFGFFSLLHTVSDALIESRCKKAACIFSVLYIENPSETLELDVRCAIQKSLTERRVLVILYNKLPEEEVLILWRLCDEYKHIFIAQKEDAISALLNAYKASSKNSL